MSSPPAADSELAIILRNRPLRNLALAVFAAAYAIFFWRMTRGGLRSWFSEDDLLGIYYTFSHSLRALIGGNILFFTGYSRPMSAALLHILYSLFGFHPAPYNLVRMALCAIDVVLLYLFSSNLAGSREVGVLTVMLAGFHPSMESLYLDSGMIYDPVAYFFYFLAFILYLHFRRDGRVPGLPQAAAVLVLFIAALDAKEMAVSFPVAIVLYEITACPRDEFSLRSLPALLRRFATGLAAGFLTLIFIVGKNTGAGALSGTSAYRPRISLAVYLDSYAHYAGQFLFLGDTACRPYIGYILIACIALALMLRIRVMLWASLFNLAAILPISFIPFRNGFECMIPVAGWGIYFAALLADARERLVEGHPALRLPSQAALAAGLALWVLAPEADIMQRHVLPVAHSEQFANRETWRTLRAALPDQVTGKRILAIREPFSLGYALLFMIQLGYNDHTVKVDTMKLLHEWKAPVTPANYDYVIDYDGTKFLRVPSAAK